MRRNGCGVQESRRFFKAGCLRQGELLCVKPESKTWSRGSSLRFLTSHIPSENIWSREENHPPSQVAPVP